MTREERIQQLVDNTNMTIDDATFAVDFADGKIEGDVRTGSAAERRRRGLGMEMLPDDDLRNPLAGRR